MCIGDIFSQKCLGDECSQSRFLQFEFVKIYSLIMPLVTCHGLRLSPILQQSKYQIFKKRCRTIILETIVKNSRGREALRMDSAFFWSMSSSNSSRHDAKSSSRLEACKVNNVHFCCTAFIKICRGQSVTLLNVYNKWVKCPMFTCALNGAEIFIDYWKKNPYN